MLNLGKVRTYYLHNWGFDSKFRLKKITRQYPYNSLRLLFLKQCQFLGFNKVQRYELPTIPPRTIIASFGIRGNWITVGKRQWLRFRRLVETIRNAYVEVPVRAPKLTASATLIVKSCGHFFSEARQTHARVRFSYIAQIYRKIQSCLYIKTSGVNDFE